MKYGIFLAGCCLIPSICFATVDRVSVIGSTSQSFNNSYQKNTIQLALSLINQKKIIICANNGSGLSGIFLKTISDKKANFISVDYPTEDEKLCPPQHPCKKIESKKVARFADQTEYLISNTDGIVFLPGGFDVLYAFNYLQALSERDLMDYKPVVFLNTNHYWDRLKEMLIEMKRQNIISQNILDTIAFENKPENVIKTLERLEKTIQSLSEKNKL